MELTRMAEKYSVHINKILS